MLGTKAEPALRTKAAGAIGRLLFANDMANTLLPRMGTEGPRIARLANVLVRHMEIMDTNPRVFPKPALKDPGPTKLFSGFYRFYRGSSLPLTMCR